MTMRLATPSSRAGAESRRPITSSLFANRRLRIISCLLMCQAVRSSSISIDKYESVQSAVEILHSVGAWNVCHPTSTDFEPFLPLCESNTHPFRALSESEAPLPPFTLDAKTIRNILMSLLCVIIAALAAGLTIGLLNIDPLTLHLKIRAPSSPLEKEQALKILPIVQKHHQLLVTLLLMNSLSNEALPLFLDNVVPSYVAVILSVTLVLCFGEIIPTALFTGPNQIAIVSSLTPLVEVFMVFFAPIAIPIGKLLDWLLGEESGELYNRKQMTALVRLTFEEKMGERMRRNSEVKRRMSHLVKQRPSLISAVESIDTAADCETACDGFYSMPQKFTEYNSVVSERHDDVVEDEVLMVEGALSMATQRVVDILSPMRKVSSVRSDAVLDHDFFVDIYSKGFSRVPVYLPSPDGDDDDKSAIIGVLITKQLIVVNPEDNRTASSMPLHKPFCVHPKQNLVDMLNLFQKGARATLGGHLALVCFDPAVARTALDQDLPIPKAAGLVGIITLEDVIEHLIQEKIYDENDEREQIDHQRAMSAFQKWTRFTSKKVIARKEKENMEEEVATQPLLGDGQGDENYGTTSRSSFFSFT